MKAINLSSQTAYVVENKKLILSGDITIQSVSQLFKKNKWIIEQELEEVDCALVTSADSSCLALMIFLQEKSKKTLQIKNLPNALLGLVDLYEIKPLLSI